MQPSNRTIIGVAMLLFGAVILGVGMHHVVKTGTCSSTGYSSHYGPVPYCPKGTGWWILFIIAGIFLAIIGGFVSGGVASALLIIPAVFSGIGIGALTVAFDSSASSSTKTFSAIFGGAFAFFGLVPLLIGGVSALRRTGARTPTSPFSPTTLKNDPIMGGYTSTPATTTAPTTLSGLGSFSTPNAPAASSGPAGGARPSSSDALDKIEKLAKLREQGALTEDEFNREKAKLLAEL